MNKRNKNEMISTVSHKENLVSKDTNLDTTTAMEPLSTGYVKDDPIVAMLKRKKSKRVSSRGVTKRGLLVDDETCSPHKPSIDNEGSDNIVESTEIP